MSINRALVIAARRALAEEDPRRDRRIVAFVLTTEQYAESKNDTTSPSSVLHPQHPLPHDPPAPSLYGKPILITTAWQQVPADFYDLRHVTGEPTRWTILLRCEFCGKELVVDDLSDGSTIGTTLDALTRNLKGCDHIPTPVEIPRPGTIYNEPTVTPVKGDMVVGPGVPSVALPTLDPDCRDNKHRSCIGGPCECWCHEDSCPKCDSDAPILRRGITGPGGGGGVTSCNHDWHSPR